ncbi:MAG: tyrosine--tRNA ligase [Clostridia bacterium]
MKKLYESLKERGFVYQYTNEEQVKNLVNGKTTVYVGIDPTADSLHIGHCLPLIMLKRFQDWGHKVIVLLGGATAQIGDPSGKNNMRKMIDTNFINTNLSQIKALISKFIKLDGENPAIIVNNADWTCDKKYIDFMREVGVHFNVSKMLASDSCAKRLENGGLTFLEMGYMLIQANDFVHLNRTYGCMLQVGGSDQWANMLAGVELGRKLNHLEGKSEDSFQAFTVPLLTNSEGVKMGKTVNGALWVDKNKTSVYDFYQYFINIDDRDVEKLLLMLTEIDLKKINSLVSTDIREAKRVMALEVTALVHGRQNAIIAQETAHALFQQGDAKDAPTFELNKSLVNFQIVDLLYESKLCASKGEGRRLIEQGGVQLNGNKVEKFSQLVCAQDFTQGYAIIKKGKKQFLKVVLK